MEWSEVVEKGGMEGGWSDSGLIRFKAGGGGRGDKSAPKAPQDLPRAAQDLPRLIKKRPQSVRRRPQEASKTLPRLPAPQDFY